VDQQNRQIDRTEMVTKCNMEDQAFFMGFMKRSSIRVRVEILDRHRVLIHKVIKKWPGLAKEEASYSALILANKAVHGEKQDLLSLNFDGMSLDDIRDVTLKKVELHIDKVFKRDRPQREKLMKHWGDVKMLRALNKKKVSSFKAIAKYLKRVHSCDVGSTLIFDTWHELEDVKETK